MLLASLKKSSEFSFLTTAYKKLSKLGLIFENGEKDPFPFRFGVREVKGLGLDL
jgi:hypothetical protein